MILRLRGRDGQFRFTVNDSDDFTTLIPQLAEKLPKDVDISSITVNPKPSGGESRKLSKLKGISFQRVGLRLVD